MRGDPLSPAKGSVWHVAFGIWHLTFDKYLTLFARLNKPAFVDFAAAKGYESRRGAGCERTRRVLLGGNGHAND